MALYFSVRYSKRESIMCGICGKIYFDGRSVSPDLLKDMCRVLQHRGPDDEGVYVNGSIGLGHRRLSILDLSEAGHQPMSNADSSLWITFNGEIYNFLDLRAELEAKGHTFKSRTDTEVLIRLYEEEGFDCLSKLRGFFAFAIWDDKKNLLFLARDRLGKKPLFYRADTKSFSFASEIKSLLQDPEVDPEPDFQAIHHYLSYQYVPGPLSAFKGIRKLLPAHYMVVQNGAIQIRRYWKLKYAQKTHLSEEQICEALLDQLKEAVRLRLISDVPLGAFLSGGIDSSAVVAIMSELTSAPVKTFSIGFEEREYNELAFARIIARKFNTEHYEFVVKPEAVEILPKLVWHYNEPFADSSAVPTYYLSKMTRQYVTVALNGDAGDENFAGYERYMANKIAHYYDHFPQPVRKALEALMSRLPVPAHSTRSLMRKGKRFFEVLSEEPASRYYRWIAHFHNGLKDELYSLDFKKNVNDCESIDLLIKAYQASDARDIIDATLDVDVNTYLPDDLLVKVDIASMANSLEARSPLLDHKFMEFAAAIPANLKLHGWRKKYIFKKALSGILPPEVLNRPKMGFGVPIDHWFRMELKEMAYDTLLSSRCLQRGYFRGAFIRRMLDEHVSGLRPWHHHLWNLLLLELWHRMFID